jgi:hypothetical protein
MEKTMGWVSQPLAVKDNDPTYLHLCISGILLVSILEKDKIV